MCQFTRYWSLWRFLYFDAKTDDPTEAKTDDPSEAITGNELSLPSIDVGHYPGACPGETFFWLEPRCPSYLCDLKTRPYVSRGTSDWGFPAHLNSLVVIHLVPAYSNVDYLSSLPPLYCQPCTCGGIQNKALPDPPIPPPFKSVGGKRVRTNNGFPCLCQLRQKAPDTAQPEFTAQIIFPSCFSSSARVSSPLPFNEYSIHPPLPPPAPTLPP